MENSNRTRRSRRYYLAVINTVYLSSKQNDEKNMY
jgi:hypothetical protein